MCTCLFLYDPQLLFPQLLLLLVFNRDEYFARPTQTAHFWPDHPSILAGRDAVGKGTWLGISKNGRFAIITNFREPPRAKDPQTPVATPSRGDIPTKFLLGTQTPVEYLQALHAQKFAGFNTVVGDLSQGQVAYYSNRGGELPKLLQPGLHGVSNGLLMQWPKVQRGLNLFETLLQQHNSTAATGEPHWLPWEQLLEVMGDTQKPPDQEVPLTGVGEDFDRALSSIFIEELTLAGPPVAKYGTRSQTVLAVWRDGHVELRERYRDMQAGAAWAEDRHAFELEAVLTNAAGADANNSSREEL